MKITYENKEDIIGYPDVERKNKVTAGDMNEIKNAVNNTDADLVALQKQVNFGEVPIGAIISIPANATIPTNWLACNGQSLNKTEYPKLYTAIGNIYGSSSTTFNLPNQNAGANEVDASLIPSYNFIIRVK